MNHKICPECGSDNITVMDVIGNMECMNCGYMGVGFLEEDEVESEKGPAKDAKKKTIGARKAWKDKNAKKINKRRFSGKTKKND